MARIQVITCVWKRIDVVDGDGVATSALAFVPIRQHAAIAARQFALDSEYPIAPIEPRSRASHDHYFAALHEGFVNLPEKFAARFPNEEHLRHWLLIETNWCREVEVDAASEKEARKLRKEWWEQDPYARIKVIGSKVIIRRAVSQNRSMGKKEFQASKQDVLELLSEIIGVSLSTLKREAKRKSAIRY